MWRKSENVLHRLFDRQISTNAPNTHLHRARMLYENIFPSFTVYDVECPDYYFRKFSNDGQYLICFSRDYQDLIVYRHNWLTYSCKGELSATEDELPSKGKKFDSYFSLLYSVNLASGNEVICKDIFLTTDCNSYGIFATATTPDSDAPATPGAIPGVPSIERITLYLVRLADGNIMDERKFRNDFIHLVHNTGIFLYDDLLSVLSVRYQVIHILQVREAGMFVDVRTIGPFCREDDELIINSHAQGESLFQSEWNSFRKDKGLSSEEIFWPGSLDIEGRAVSAKFKSQGHSVTGQQQNHEISGGLSSQGYCGSVVGDGLVRVFRDSQDLYGGMGIYGTGPENPPRGLDFSQRAAGMIFSDSLNVSANGFPLDPGGRDIVGYAGMYSQFLGEREGQWSTGPSSSGNGGFQPGLPGSYGMSYRNASSESQGNRRGSQSLYLNSSSDTLSNGRHSISGGSFHYGDPMVAAGHHRSEGSVEYVVSSRLLATEGSQRESRRPEESVPGNALPPGTRETHMQSPLLDTSIGRARSRVSRSSFSRSNTSVEVYHTGPSTDGTAMSARELNGSLATSGISGLSHRPTSPARSSQEFSSFEENLGIHDDLGRGQVLGGMKQRLMSFIFRTIWNEDMDPVAKSQRLKRFYYHFQHYVDLLMWKVQFLDRYHLLIKFGSVDGVMSRNSDSSHQTAFFVVYNIVSTKILGFYPNSSGEFLQLFEQYYDFFRVAPRRPLYMQFLSSYSNNNSAREHLRKLKIACNNSKSSGHAQVVKRTLASLPCNSQAHSPSAYFDQSLFHFDEKLISATDQYKPCMEHPIKFISRRRPNTLKFKINPGLEFGAGDGRVKRVASFIFHPILPFAISIQQSFMQPAVVNFHLRR